MQKLYVDDGLLSVDTVEEAVDLLSKTQKILREEENIRLHKLASNDPKVCNAFPKDDLAKDLKDLNLNLEETSLQRTFGVSWSVHGHIYMSSLAHPPTIYKERGTCNYQQPI